MQKDFHYCCTYILARCAGIKRESASRIATCAQLVDDSVKLEQHFYKDGSSVLHEVTAHHALSIENLDNSDQRKIWIPFHFLPGGEGKTFSEKVICIKNSPISQKMVLHALAQKDATYGDYLIGITAHVYADTFAHFGFSGISSKENRVERNSIVLNTKSETERERLTIKQKDFDKKYLAAGILDNFSGIISGLSQIASGALGHGAVITYPDLPYLSWSFRYKKRKDFKIEFEKRDNGRNFLEASYSLFEIFKEYSQSKPDIIDKTVKLTFLDIEEPLAKLFAYENNRKKREEKWDSAIKENLFYDFPENSIPGYKGFKWLEAFFSSELKTSKNILMKEAYQFFSAADFHREYIVKELLPEHNIVVY